MKCSVTSVSCATTRNQGLRRSHATCKRLLENVLKPPRMFQTFSQGWRRFLLRFQETHRQGGGREKMN